MLAAIVKGPSLEKIIEEINLANTQANLIELRVDCFDKVHIQDLIHIRYRCMRPVILTLREKSQGGQFSGSIQERIALIQKLLILKPDYLDLEWDVDSKMLMQLKQENPQLKIILSFHNLDDDQLPPPHDAIKIADVVKVAVRCDSTLKAFRFLKFCKENGWLGVALGENGTFGRILSRTFHFPWTYANLSEDESGRLSIKTLEDVYGYSKLTQQTSIYGLIGDPVEASMGHFVHNQVMQKLKMDAVYIKMKVSSTELSDFFSHLKTMPWKGLSVTMPLKESIMPFLDFVDEEAQKIGAVNTVVFKNGQAAGFNTDGYGLLKAVLAKLPDLQRRRVIILGGGGAAKAAGYVLKKEGAEVVFLIREPKKMLSWTATHGCQVDRLDKWPTYYGPDLLINAIPNLCPIDTTLLDKRTCVMDMTVRPIKTQLIQEAEKQGCSFIFGWEMFAAQALKQQEIWFPNFDEMVYPLVQRIASSSSSNI